jgi:hypothetical protein
VEDTIIYDERLQQLPELREVWGRKILAKPWALWAWMYSIEVEQSY